MKSSHVRKSSALNITVTTSNINTTKVAPEYAELTADKDVSDLQASIYFYKQLIYKSSVKPDEKSQEMYKFHKKYLSRLKFFFLILYIGVLPFLETPEWCLSRIKDSGKARGQIILDCEDLGVPHSHFPKFSPTFISVIEFFCLAFFVYFRWSKTRWGEVKPKHR